MKRSSHHAGQTLFEIIISVAVIAVILTALVSAVTAALRYGQASRNRSRAVKYAQEGLELARALRDTAGWDLFLTYSGSGTKRWCVDESGVWTADSGNGCPIASGSPFGRTVDITWNTPLMSVDVAVAWGEKDASSTIHLQTYFTKWK